MSPEQFAALAELLRLRDGQAQAVARMVLVDGLTVADASKSTGLGYTAAHQAVKRARRGLALAQLVAGPV
jgi:DNA-directed RNA polymerase specialized sigma24 family protein